jgi:Transposase DDE domain
MCFATPFFHAFKSLLFGKPPVSGLKKALADLPKIGSLAELRHLFGSYIPAALLARTSCGDNSRQRIFSLEVIFWAFLDQGLTPFGPCREAVRKIMAWHRFENPRGPIGDVSADTSAYCQARLRLPLQTIKAINTHLTERLQINTPTEALWHGRRIKLVDGTGISMPDTAANQALYPQTKSQKPGCGFPLMNLVGIFCLSSGALLEVAYGERRTHETKLFASLWHTVEKGDVMVTDRGFCSFGAFAGLLTRGADALMRLTERRCRQAIGPQLPKNGNCDLLITWKRPSQPPPSMSPQQFESLPESLTVRVVRMDISRRGFRTQSITLVTTLNDPAITAQELAALYLRRWEIELHFREIKVLLNMDVLRCKTPEMIERELLMHVVAYNLIRSLMQTSAAAHGADLSRLSFKGCLDTVRHFANAAHAAEGKPRTIKALLEEMLAAVAKDPNPDRPGRSEPRAVKRRRKNYHLLTKPRHDMGHLPHRKIGRDTNPKSTLT